MGVAELVEGGGDFVEGGFFDAVFGVAREIGSGLAGDGPAGPGAPFALLASRFAEAVGVVLEVDARVSEEDVGRGVAEDVEERGVGEWVLFKDVFESGEVGAPGAIEAKDSAGGESVSPEVLGVLEAGEVERGSAVVAAEFVERFPGHAFRRSGQGGDVGKLGDRWHGVIRKFS